MSADTPAGAGGGACANCGHTLTGPYCAQCGQRAHLHRSLLHLAEELLHGLFHFETRSWRTLPLRITRPGLLTRRYIDGQRTSYVAPLGLFLFMMFLTFVVVAWTSDPVDVAATPTPTPLQTAQERAELQQTMTPLGGAAWGLYALVAPWHMFRQLRGAYGLRASAAWWRTAALPGVASTAFTLFVLFALAVSFA
jgi:hypothetical protein